MRNLWLVARYEYRRIVGRRGFIIGTLAIPLGMAALIAVAVLVETISESDQPLGYVDQGGLLDSASPDDLADPEDRLTMLAFPNLEAAQKALEEERIQAFFIIPAGYPESGQIDLYYLDSAPEGNVRGDFSDYLRLNLTASLPDDVQNRVLEGSAVTVKDIESNRTFGKESVINVILPIFASFIFMFATMTAAGYMLQVVANEKENRTIEIMVTSVTTKQFIFGKAAGLLGATLSQLGIYALAAVVGLKIAASYTTVLTAIEIPWGYLGVMALFFFPAYTLLSAIMIAIGSMVTELQQGQQAAGILNLMFLLPVIVLPLLFQDPGHPGVLAMTLFPTTSFLTISLRWGMGTVPSWQIGLSWVFLVATTLSVIWLAARIFRAGMLHYGQPLKFKAIWVALRAS